MRTVREDREAEDALEAACRAWARTQDAWDAIIWVLSRDPTVGTPLSEGGAARSLVYQGSWAHEMPTIQIVYVIEA